MEELNTLWAEVQPVLSSYPVLILIGILLVLGVVKKLIKLALTAGLLVIVWLIIQQLGVTPPL